MAVIFDPIDLNSPQQQPLLWRSHFLRRDAYDFAHLPIPIWPDVAPGRLTVFVGYSTLEQDIGKTAIDRQPWVVSPTINIEIG
jgi:hypothetical protein